VKIRIRNSTSRTGVAILECVAAFVLLGASAVVIAPFISRLGQARTELLHRQLAVVELRNLAEAVLASEKEPVFTLSEEAQRQLKQAQLQVTRKRISSQDFPQSQVTLALSWVNLAGERVIPLTLSFWQPADAEESQ
jgi:hypothetical protein